MTKLPSGPRDPALMFDQGRVRTGTVLPTPSRTEREASAERKLAIAVLLKAIDDLERGSYTDRLDAEEFLYSTDSAQIRRFWLDVAGVNVEQAETHLQTRKPLESAA